MVTTVTKESLTPSELTECRKNLQHQWENQKIDQELLKRAWLTAHHIATVLYEDYGAAKVAVFGSLADGICFTEKSDIDIVVWGLSYDKCIDVVWEIEDFRPEFKIDITDFETSKGVFRQRILNQAIPIEKHETGAHIFTHKPQTTLYTETEALYEVNRDRLIQRISDERTKIERTVRGVKNALIDIDSIHDNHKKYVEKTIASDLVEIFTGIERLFERIARGVDRNIPSGGNWHRDLLAQMAAHHEKRPALISKDLESKLHTLLKFRHRVNNIYRDDLIYEKVEKHAKQVSDLFQDVSRELDNFIEFLRNT